jgi:hypothetical protein
VLALKQPSSHGGNPAEHLAIRVDDVPAAGFRDMLRGSDERRHPSDSQGHDAARNGSARKRPMLWEIPPVEQFNC